MNKKLIKSLDEWIAFILTDELRWEEKFDTTPPEQFPAIIAWTYRCDKNGPDIYTQAFIYESDFR